ncbi:MAG: CDP-diacylglycerol--serine O-phosphatidyltransferase [archaeon]
MIKLKDWITLANLAFGFAAIIFILEGDYQTGTRFILLAALADGSDGFISRKFSKPDDYGRELDSLCDLVSFGVAPALLIYKSIVGGFLGIFVGLALLSAAALRLARFNLVSGGDRSLFIGLPVPASAILVVTYFNTHIVLERYLITAFLLFLALLNISEFRYPSQKRGLKKRQVLALVIIIGFFLYYVKEGLMWNFLFVSGVIYLMAPLYYGIRKYIPPRLQL